MAYVGRERVHSFIHVIRYRGVLESVDGRALENSSFDWILLGYDGINASAKVVEP
jgi:hypothetical protein